MSTPRMLRRAASTASARVVAEPSGLAVIGVFYVMVTAVLATLWTTATHANGSTIVGYSATALVWYVATSEAATVALPMRLIEEIGDDIGSERVVVELLRPASVLSLRVATEIGKMLPRLAVCVSIGVVFATIFAGPPPNAGALALAAPALLLAIAINLVAQHAFAAAAFWVRDAKGTWFLYQKLVFVLGGMLLPLEVLPAKLESMAKLLPFMAMAYAPARLASGHLEPALLAVQAFWLAVVWLAAVKVFAAGERRLLGAVT
jgi:ABC-2 type transport system permease protein